jgi:hypothetical protein
MPYVKVKGSLKRVEKALSSYGVGGKPVVIPILHVVGDEAVTFMRRIIETTPSGIVEGKPDRVWTGHMRDEVSYEIQNPKRAVYTLVVGWVNDQEDYFKWQDTGNPQRAGQWKIKGMHMIHQGSVYAREGVRDELTRAKSNRIGR